MNLRGAVVLAVIVSGIVIQAQAQPQPRVPLTVLQKGDVSVPWLETVATVADFEPGATVGRHSHPGEMVAYMVSGSVVVEVDGKAPETVEAGQSFIIPEGVVHNFTNQGSAPAKMFATYFVEKEKPLTSRAEPK